MENTTPQTDPELLKLVRESKLMEPESALIELCGKFMEAGHKQIALVIAAGVANIRSLKEDLIAKEILLAATLESRDAVIDELAKLKGGS